jgi:hypothetical protein
MNKIWPAFQELARCTYICTQILTYRQQIKKHIFIFRRDQNVSVHRISRFSVLTTTSFSHIYDIWESDTFCPILELACNVYFQSSVMLIFVLILMLSRYVCNEDCIVKSLFNLKFAFLGFRRSKWSFYCMFSSHRAILMLK